MLLWYVEQNIHLIIMACCDVPYLSSQVTLVVGPKKPERSMLTGQEIATTYSDWLCASNDASTNETDFEKSSHMFADEILINEQRIGELSGDGVDHSHAKAAREEIRHQVTSFTYIAMSIIMFIICLAVSIVMY